MVERKAKVIPQRWNYEFRDPSAVIEQAFNHAVPTVPVHKHCLWGIQTTKEYERIKRKRLEADFAKLTDEQIIQILEDHPVHAVAIPMNPLDMEKWDELDLLQKYSLTVLDGHHRIRFSPETIKEIPTMIFTVQQAFEVYRKRYKGSVQDFVAQIVGERDEALQSFTKIKESLLPSYVRITPSGLKGWGIEY